MIPYTIYNIYNNLHVHTDRYRTYIYSPSRRNCPSIFVCLPTFIEDHLKIDLHKYLAWDLHHRAQSKRKILADQTMKNKLCASPTSVAACPYDELPIPCRLIDSDDEDEMWRTVQPVITKAQPVITAIGTKADATDDR